MQKPISIAGMLKNIVWGSLCKSYCIWYRFSINSTITHFDTRTMSSSPLAAILPESPALTARIIKKIKKDPELTAGAAGLNYIKAGAAGYIRKGKAPRFFYENQKGERCRDQRILKRIKALVLPPAWKNVWISKDPEGHLQATGVDEAGRKQYRYHPFWNQIRNETKYYRLLSFSEVLPDLRAQVESDLRKRDYNLEKVSALVIRLMDKTCIRVGNEQYKIRHGSSGLTTLDARCTTIKGKSITAPKRLVASYTRKLN